MNNISKTIIFFGTDDFSAVSLRSLIEAGYKIAAVVTKPDSKSGRGQHLTPPPVKLIANDHKIPVWQPQKVSEIEPEIKKIGQVAGVLASYGKIIPQSTISLFNPGIINIHPSLLPIYRGPSPIESAISNQDKQTGVSIMQLTEKMDAGPIYGQIIHELSGLETAPELYQTLAGAGSALLMNLLPFILDGSLQPVSQDEAAATYCQLLNKFDAWIRFDEIDADAAEAQIRAQLIFPKSKTQILGHDVIITKSHISNDQKSRLDIECRDGRYLSIDELIAPNGRKMSGEAFLNGYSNK